MSHNGVFGERNGNTGVVVIPTQVFLNYMNIAGGEEKEDKLLVCLYDIQEDLRRFNIRTDIVFRGNRKNRDLFSDTISDELWYWRSNGFIEEDEEHIRFSEKGKIYFASESKIDDGVNWNLNDNVKSILKETIKKVRQSIG